MAHTVNVTPGKEIVIRLSPRLALDVYLHLAGSQYSELTTTSSRVHVAGILPQLRRALVASGFVAIDTLDTLAAELARKPLPPALDQPARNDTGKS
jgi:hypothetical protein